MPDDHSALVPPLPIPNRTVKRRRADDSAATSVKVGNRQACDVRTPLVKTLGAFVLVRAIASMFSGRALRRWVCEVSDCECQSFSMKSVDAIRKLLHNLVSLLLTNKTIRGAAPEGVGAGGFFNK